MAEWKCRCVLWMTSTPHGSGRSCIPFFATSRLTNSPGKCWPTRTSRWRAGGLGLVGQHFPGEFVSLDVAKNGIQLRPEPWCVLVIHKTQRHFHFAILIAPCANGKLYVGTAPPVTTTGVEIPFATLPATVARSRCRRTAEHLRWRSLAPNPGARN